MTPGWSAVDRLREEARRTRRRPMGATACIRPPCPVCLISHRGWSLSPIRSIILCHSPLASTHHQDRER